MKKINFFTAIESEVEVLSALEAARCDRGEGDILSSAKIDLELVRGARLLRGMTV